jgi:hypothetical protein
MTLDFLSDHGGQKEGKKFSRAGKIPEPKFDIQ